METKHVIGRRVREARLSAGFTQEQLAQRIGLKSTRTLQRWEAGATKPYPRQLFALARATGRDAGYFDADDDADPDRAARAGESLMAALHFYVAEVTGAARAVQSGAYAGPDRRRNQMAPALHEQPGA